jgi:hypothetical protein
MAWKELVVERKEWLSLSRSWARSNGKTAGRQRYEGGKYLYGKLHCMCG